MAISSYPVPDGIEPFQRGILEDGKGGGVLIDCYQLGSVIVAFAHGNRLLRLEVKTVELDGRALTANLLGFAATDGCCWTSLLVDSDQYSGRSPKELNLEFLAIEDDDE